MKMHKSITMMVFVVALGVMMASCGEDYTDNDGDGYYADKEPYDCDDNDASVYPGATEYCDGKDNNCDWWSVADEDCVSCDLMKAVSSAANIANGNILHDQPLFEGMSLYYNSLNPYNWALGNKWSHSYDIRVLEADDSSVFFRDGSGKWRLYTPSGDGYAGQPGNYAVLSKSGGVFTITTRDGEFMKFNADGMISTVADRNGNTMLFTYWAGHLAAATDSKGRTTTFTVDDNGRIKMIKAPSGNILVALSTGDLTTPSFFVSIKHQIHCNNMQVVPL